MTYFCVEWDVKLLSHLKENDSYYNLCANFRKFFARRYICYNLFSLAYRVS